MDNGQMYHVYQNQAAAAYCPFISSFFSLQFSNIKIFRHTFIRNCEALKIETWYTGGIYRVYQNKAAAAYLSFYLSFFSFSNIQTLKIFVTLFSGTGRPRQLKLGAHIDNRWMYWNQVAAAYLSLYFFIFLSLQFSNIKMFLSHCSQEL